MKRRNFLQWILGLSIVGVPSIKSKAVKITETKSYNGLYQDSNFKSSKVKRLGYTCLNMANGSLEFPGEILCIGTIDGRLIVDCEHSIWEVKEKNGDFQRIFLGNV